MNAKDVVQTKAAKEAYTKDNQSLINLLTGRRTRQELSEILNVSERKVRLLISELSMFYPVIATSDKAGYILPKAIEDCSLKELEEYCEKISHAINELESRIKVIKKRMKPLIAYLRVAEGVINDTKKVENSN